MKRVYAGAIVAAVQCLLVLSVAGKYAWDRERLPRAWANVSPVDPNLPVRGRYASLNVHVELQPNQQGCTDVTLSANEGKLVASNASGKNGLRTFTNPQGGCVLAERVAFFLPEHAKDPTRLEPGEQLWAEFSIPKNGPPRPIRLAVKRGDTFQPLELR